jgi:hypothetical protein
VDPTADRSPRGYDFSASKVDSSFESLFVTSGNFNYASINNIVGADFAPPLTVHGTAGLSPSQRWVSRPLSQSAKSNLVEGCHSRETEAF